METLTEFLESKGIIDTDQIVAYFVKDKIGEVGIDIEEIMIDYAKQKVKERDEQWLNTMIELGHLTDTELIDEVNEKLQKVKVGI